MSKSTSHGWSCGFHEEGLGLGFKLQSVDVYLLGRKKFGIWLPLMKTFILNPKHLEPDIGGSIVGIGFWGTLYYNHIKEPPHSSVGK